MALAQCTVSGVIQLPDTTIPIYGAKLVFILSNVEEETEIIAPIRVEATVNTSTGAFSVDLWPNALGTTESAYYVTLERFGATAARPVAPISLGTIYVPDAASAALSDLIQTPPFTPPSASILVLADAAKDAAAASAVAASGSADDAAASAVAAGVSETNAAASAASIDATAFALTLLDDADAATARTTLGLGSSDAVEHSSVTSTGAVVIKSLTPTFVLYDTDATSTHAQVRFRFGSGTLFQQTYTSSGGFVATDHSIQLGSSGAVNHKWKITGADRLVLDSSGATVTGNVAVSGTVDGRDLAADGTKLDYLTVTQAVDLDQLEIDVAALGGGLVYKGTWDASAGTFPGGGTASQGDLYIVSTGGTVGGEAFSAGEQLIALVDNASTTVFAANWSHPPSVVSVTSVAGLTGTVSAAGLRTAINVEDGADVTDTANVTAAGALMDSEVDADIKTLSLPADTTISTFGASLVDDTTAAAARTTLGIVIGTDVQAYSADLATYAASPLTTAELDQLQNIETTTITSSQWGYLGAASAFGASLLDDADAATARATLGVTSLLGDTTHSFLTDYTTARDA